MGRPKNDCLLPYMAFARGIGNNEAAVLVYAHTIKEAKKTAWAKSGVVRLICDDNYLELVVMALPRHEYYYRNDYCNCGSKNFHEQVPFVNENPPSCKFCGRWGGEPFGLWLNPLNDDGVCFDCEAGND